MFTDDFFASSEHPFVAQFVAQYLDEYGEERYSRRIARAIVAERKQKRLERTQELAELIVKSYPRNIGKTPNLFSF